MVNMENFNMISTLLMKMNQKLIAKFFICLAVFTLLGVKGVQAEKIPIKIGKGGPGGNKSPMYIPFSCESTDNGIVVFSYRDIIGEVKIVNEDGEIIAETCGNFNPNFFIPVDDFSGHLTITIYIADWDMTYVGYIEGE